MNMLVFEALAIEHLADLRREAAAYGCAARRSERARPTKVRRRLALPHLHRASAVGCEA